MTGSADNTTSAPHIVGPPSLVELAAATLRRMIVGGDLLCGQRIVENRLTGQLGISRPPLREALRVLEREGLVRQVPRKGVIVTPLTLHDIYEICTLRAEFERLAIRLGVPVTDPARRARCQQALQAMTDAARTGDRPAYLERSFEFHVSVVGLSGHARLEEAYRSLQLQLMLSMALNRRAREEHETLDGDVARHTHLLEIIDTGDPQAVLDELATHGDRSFLDGIEDTVDGHTDVALAWLAQQRTGRKETR
ncbi:GntR family transcriptional regulator [Saccharopolyspora endophytica]|uniref:GntR family transcriptional regulator n=1 Tax=Saccharopolyspora endophytica TaxID=543886 RepID=A0ABS5DCS7_9PSEU|nr:GntR family transcriptional regulator [Saccharopolyspora endophytica]MBQ0924089.1 GntR family transcriptional regulator [Saccharopolyspora endophytica]